MQNIDLKEFIKDIHDEFKEISRTANIEFNYVCPADLFVYTDPILTQRVLINLITNAIKYTHKGSVSITAELVDAEVMISVKDTGQGIPKDKLDSIFEEFYQLNDDKNTAQKGMGLGLSIVKRLADLQNYSITVTSNIDKGSVFSFCLPLATSEELNKNRNDSLLATTFDASLHKILVIEDEPDILEAMDLLLKKWNYQVVCVKNSQQALEYMHKPDNGISLIISDYGLGEDFSGVEITKQLLKVKPLPVIIITGSTKTEHIQDITKNNMLLINKPVIPGRLRVAMQNLLR